MPAFVETMAYSRAGGVPWHGAGTPCDTILSADALRLGGIDWQVETTPVYTKSPDGFYYEVPDALATRRIGDGAHLATVGADYVPIQNAEALDLLDGIAPDYGLRYETVGSLHNGRVVWLLAQMPDSAIIAGDEHKTYILLSTSHDGSQALRVATTDVRVVCANTLALASRDLKASHLRVSHRGNVRARLEEARRVITVTNEARERFRQWAEAAAVARVGKADYAAFEVALFRFAADATSKDIADNRGVQSFRRIFSEESKRAGAVTAYALLQGVTGYADHGMVTRGGAEGRFASTQMGAAAQFKARGLGLLRDMVKA